MTETVETNEITFTEDDIATAGLRPEGWYMFELKSQRDQHVDAGVSQRTGKPYDAFNTVKASVLSKARAFYNDLGEFQREEPVTYGFPMTVDLSDNQTGLARLKGLYKAITEQNLSGDGGIQSTLDELMGQQFWARLYHRKDREGILRENLDTFRFRSKSYGPPATIAVAQG